MTGWRTPLTPELLGDFPNEVVGIIADRNYPDFEQVTEILAKAPRDTVIVLRYANKEDIKILQAVMKAGFEPLLTTGLPEHWKGIDDWRDGELLNTCSKVLVFRDKASDAKASWLKRQKPPYNKVWPHLFVFEAGKKKPKKRPKGRSGE